MWIKICSKLCRAFQINTTHTHTHVCSICTFFFLYVHPPKTKQTKLASRLASPSAHAIYLAISFIIQWPRDNVFPVYSFHVVWCLVIYILYKSAYFWVVGMLRAGCCLASYTSLCFMCTTMAMIVPDDVTSVCVCVCLESYSRPHIHTHMLQRIHEHLNIVLRSFLVYERIFDNGATFFMTQFIAYPIQIII